jgi:EmrB/QacA subfamily drug resistance transporter
VKACADGASALDSRPPAPDSAPASALASERVAVTVAALASFLTPFSGAATNVALPSLGREFQLDAVALSWVGMAFLLAAAACLVPFGRLADIHGRRRVFLWGAVVYAVASVGCGFAPTPSGLIAARVVQGVGGAAIFGTNVAILTSVLPPGKRGAALGLNVAAVYLGLSLGPFLGGVLTEHAGWRSLFYLSGVLGATVAVVVALGLRGEWAESRGEPFDAAGAVLYAVGLLALMYGFSLLPSRAGGLLVVFGLLTLLAFVSWEKRARHPVVPVLLFSSNRVFAFSNLAALINYSATFAVGFLLSLYLQYASGLGPQAAGLVLVAQPVVMTAVSPFAGRLSDRVQPRIVASLGMGVTVLGLALLGTVGSSTPLSYIVVCLAVLGCGFGLFSSPNTNAVMGSVERRMYGVASASLATMRLTGQMLSLAIAMLLLSLFVGSAALTPAQREPLVAAVRTAFAVFAVLCVAGIFASLARGSTLEQPVPRGRDTL